MLRLVAVAVAGILGVVGWCCQASCFAADAPPAPAGIFGGGRAYYHEMSIAPYRFRSTVIALHFDVGRGIVYGDEKVVVLPKRSGTELPFNSVGIRYSAIAVEGKRAAYSIDARRETVDVHLRPGASANKPIAVEFQYSATPQRGVFFVRPDAAYPDIVPEIWSQGEPTDNRRWFPTWDEPDEKTPSELIITVPRGWTVVANGLLQSRIRSKSTETWDWKSSRPMSTYLISFAAGPLVKQHTRLGSLDVDSFVQPQYAGLNALCFGRTKDMIAYFQRIIGVAFPWEKYDQTTAERYDFGGMEDASATLVTAEALHPPIEDQEQSCDVLVSHELAQQWWGDDATMVDWPHLWLHEGFATYFDELWSAERLGEAEFEWRRYQAQQAYFEETHRYLRPIVDRVYADPLDLFDASSHERPAQVLHMLRYLVGDARFFGATRAYLRHYAYANADTDAFFSSIDRYLGTDLTWFKSEWFYRDDYPHYIVSDRYDAQTRALTLHIEQRNADGVPFRMPIVIEVHFGAEQVRVEPMIDRNDQSVTIRGVEHAPDMVLFDPNDNVLKQLTYRKSARALAYQLVHAARVGDREWALEQLAGMTGTTAAARASAVQAIRRCAESDPFYGVRSDAVAAAAAFDDSSTVHHALHDPVKSVRLAAEAAAGTLAQPTASILSDLDTALDDPDPDVVSVALRSLGALRPPGIFARLVGALSEPSFQETIASGALDGLAAYGDADAIALVKARTAYGTPEEERDTAVIALARLAVATKQPQAALPTLDGLLLNDSLIRTRIAAAAALGMLGSDDGLPALLRAERSDSQVLVRDSAANAVMAIERARRSRAGR